VATSCAQDLTKPITYRTVAIPLHSALDAIGKQANLSLFADDQLQSEPIILAINGATTKDTMDHIASTVGGEWHKRSDKEYELVRTEEIQQELEKEAISRREANIEKALDRLTKPQTTQSNDDYYRQSAQALAAAFKILDEQHNTTPLGQVSTRYPAYNAMIGLLKLIPARWFAELRPGQKVVLSTEPNAMQQALPEGADAVIDQYQHDQNIFATEFAKAHPEPISDDAIRKRYSPRIAAMNARPARLILIVQGTQFLLGSPSIEFVAIDANGKAIGDAQETLTVESMDKRSADLQNVMAKAKADPEIPLSEESQMFTKVYQSMQKRLGDQPDMTPAQQEVLLNPAVHDPLSFLVSDGFLAVADSKKTNLVACPADNLFFINFNKVDNQAFKVASFLDEVKEDGMDVTTQDNWTTARCYDPIDEQRARTDRELLGNCLKEACMQGHISINAASQLAMSEDEERDADLAWTYVLFGDKFAPYHVGDKLLLRFFSQLTSSQIASLQSGGLTAGGLTKPQWEALQRLTFHGRMRFDGHTPDEFGDMGSYVLMHEPTEMLPNGLPDDAMVTMTATKKDILFAGMKDEVNNVYGGELSLEDIASTLAYHEANKPMEGGFSWDIAWIAPGQSNDLDFHFTFSPTLKSHDSLRETVRGQEKWDLNSLPPDLDAKLKAAIIAAKAKLDQTPATPEPTTPPSQPPA